MSDTTNTTAPYVPLKQQIKARFNALLDEVLDQLIIEPGDPNHWLAVTTSIPKGPIGGAVVDPLGSRGVGGATLGGAVYEKIGWPLPEGPQA